ncbi:MAG: ComEC/Rec2 family competence protein [Caldilineaceae bacterium]
MALLYCSISYLIGIGLGRYLWHAGVLTCATPTWLWLVPLAVLPLTPFINRLTPASPQPSVDLRWPAHAGFRAPSAGIRPGWIAASACCLAAGALRFAAGPLTPCWTPQDLAYHNLPADRAYDRAAPTVTVQGFISSYPLASDTKQRLEVTAASITAAGVTQPVAGTLRLNTGVRTRYVYGQPVRLRGRLVTPPDFEDFSYREYLARKGIHSLMYGAEIDILPGPPAGNPVLRGLYAFRARGEALLNRQLPEPYAALANGMLLGIEAGIPDDLYDQFNLTGTSHVIVISGSNVALIAGVLLAVGTRLFGRRYAVIPALIGIAAFALLVGGDAAVMRAALMGGLFVYATSIGRRSTALVSLALACWIMTLANPLTLWDVGFQLSSAATAGLILFSPMVTETFGRIFPGIGGPLTQATPPRTPTDLVGQGKAAFRGLIEDGLLITIAANITTLPLVVFYFGRLSLVSLLTNVLIAPVQSFIMLGGTLGVIVGVAGAPWLSQVILIVPWLSLVWTVAMVQWTAALPGASLDVAAYGSGALAVTYLLLGLTLTRGSLTAWGRRFLRDGLGAAGRRLASPVVLGVGGIGCVLVWMLALSQPDGRVHVHFLTSARATASSSRRRRAVRCSSTAAPVPRRSSANWARSCPSGTVTSTCSCSPIPTATT